MTKQNSVKKNDSTNLIEKTSARALDVIISASIHLVFLLSPLFFTGFIAQGLGFEKMILFYFLVLSGIVAWVTKGVITGDLRLKRTPLDWPILAIFFVYIVSSIVSINPIDSFIGSYGASTKGLAAIVLFVLFYYLLVNNLNKTKIKTIFWTLLFSGSLIIIYSFFQLFGIYILPFSFTEIRSFNPIGSLTGLSMTILIFLPILITAITQIKEIHPKINNILSIVIKVILGVITVVGLVTLTLLSGFTFWPAAIVGVVVLLMFFLSKIVKITNNNLVIPLIMFLLVIVLFVMGDMNLMKSQLPSEVSLSRGASWDIAKSSLMSSPALGSGPATFYYNFSKYKGSDFNYAALWNVRFDNASGVIFEILATVGVLGTIAFVVLLLISLSLMFLVLIKNKNTEEHSILLSLFASCVVVIILVSLFSVNNSILIISFLIFVFTTSLAVVMYPETFKTLDLSFRTSPKYALALSTIFLTVLAATAILFMMGIKIYSADHFAKKAITSSDVEMRVDYLSKAINLFPYQDRYYVELSNNYMILAKEEVSSGGNSVKIQNYLSRAIENGKKAVEISPQRARNIESLALVYENASFYTRGALEWAESLYSDLIELEPDNPLPYLRLALINMSRANIEKDVNEQSYFIGEAIKNYDKAIEIKDNMSAAYYGKAVAHERLDDNNEAIEQLKKAVILDQNNIDYRFELGRLYLNRGLDVSDIEQNATEEYVDGDVDEDDLSVESNSYFGDDVVINDDIVIAEQIFVSILQLNPNHANALYSLASLYEKVGKDDDMEKVAQRLLEVLQSEEEKEFVRAQFGI